MVSWLNHVDKAFIFKSQCELCQFPPSVCCYTQNLLGNKINCITNFQGLFFFYLIYRAQHFATESQNTDYYKMKYMLFKKTQIITKMIHFHPKASNDLHFWDIYCAWFDTRVQWKESDTKYRDQDHLAARKTTKKHNFPMIHLPLSPHSPIWRQVSASFKTENFKWISYITHSPHATMNRSITLSTRGKPATHTHTHRCRVLKFPYYHQDAGSRLPDV